MSKEKEALEPSVVLKFIDDLLKRYENKTDYNIYITKDWLLEIKQSLQRLEAIDNANPSEALECLENIEADLTGIPKHVTEYDDGFDNYLEDIWYRIDTIKQALLKAQEPKHYLKWEDLEFKNKQCIEYKVLLNGVEYYMFVCDEDEEKYDSLSKHVVLSRVKVVDEMGKPVKGHEFFDYIEADKQFFNDLHLERVEE